MQCFRIVFLGAPVFAVPSLRALHADPAFEVVLVVTPPDRPRGRGLNVQPSPVRACAQQLGLPVLCTADANRALPPRLHGRHVDYLVVVAFGQILSADLLGCARSAPVNLHASLLPRWRGASPIESTILAGDRETGVTVMAMVRELDAGPILAQQAVPLRGDETATELRETLAQLGARLLSATLKCPLDRRPQPAEGVTMCRTLKRQDGEVDVQCVLADQIERMVRAYTPWPGVRTTLFGTPVKILRAALASEPGSFRVDCAKGTVVFLVAVQSLGRNVLSGQEWARGLSGPAKGKQIVRPEN